LEEEIRYRPVSILSLLTELQTTTTLMVDLAYSAVLFNDLELAEEVIELEKRVDDLKTLLLMNTAIAVRNARDAEAMIGIMRMGTVADRISDAAGEIANIVLRGLGVDPYISEVFTRVQERIVRTKVLPGSVLTGEALGKLRLEANIGINIIAIRRGKELITNPKPKMIIREEDVLIGRGSDIGVSELDKLAKAELKKVPRPKLEVKERHL